MLNHLGTQTIETRRLILRKHRMADAEDMFHNWAADPEVSRFWGWEPHRNIEETKSLLARWAQDSAKPDAYHWIVVLKSASQAIGYVYLSDLNDVDDSASVHYALGRKHWGQGLMTEAVNGVLNFAFSQLQARRVHSHHHTGNPASGRVLEKCGMKYIKTGYRQISDCERISGGYRYYEIMAADWH